MKTLRGKDVGDAIRGDVRIIGIRWINDHLDVAFDLAVRAGGPRYATLFCARAGDMRIDVDMTGRMGVLPVWQHELVATDGQWRVVFDIQPGRISLLCSDVTLTIADAADG